MKRIKKAISEVHRDNPSSIWVLTAGILFIVLYCKFGPDEAAALVSFFIFAEVAKIKDKLYRMSRKSNRKLDPK